jgi:hypothetical protein
MGLPSFDRWVEAGCRLARSRLNRPELAENRMVAHFSGTAPRPDLPLAA